MGKYHRRKIPPMEIYHVKHNIPTAIGSYSFHYSSDKHGLVNKKLLCLQPSVLRYKVTIPRVGGYFKSTVGLE